MLPGLSASGFMAGRSVAALTPVSSTSASVTCPTVANGDVGVYVQWSANASSIPSLVTPTGFTNIVNISSSAFANEFRFAAHWKKFDGTEGGTSLSGMTGSTDRLTILHVLKFNPPVTALAALDDNAQMTAGTPSEQTLTPGTTNPVLAYGFSTSRTVAPTSSGTLVDNGVFTEVLNSTKYGHLYYEFQQSGASRTFSMTDGGGHNFILSFMLQLTF